MIPEPIDLRILPVAAGYKLVNEATGEKVTKRDDPWEVVARGRRGEAGPFDARRLLVSTNTSAATKQVLHAVKDAEVNQDASDGANIIVPLEAFATIAVILKFRKKRTRVLTAEQRAELVERMNRVRPKRAA